MLVDDTGERRLESREVRAALVRVDVVHEREDGLVEAVVVLQRQLDPDVVLYRVDRHDLVVDRLVRPVEILHELAQPALGEERLIALITQALVLERDRDALVQERQFPQTRRQRIVVEPRLGEDRAIGLEPDLGPGVFRLPLAEDLELARDVAAAEGHVVLLPVAPYPHLEILGQRVDHGDADAVQPARHLVAVLVELAAGVQHGQRQLDTGNLFRRMDVDRNPAPVVVNGDRVVSVDDDVDPRRVARHRLVDRVVHDFVDEVVQPARRGRSDVHPRPLANRFEPLQNLDVLGAVGLFLLDHCFRHESLFGGGETRDRRKPEIRVRYRR